MVMVAQVVVATPSAAQADKTFTVLYSFKGSGTDGAFPYAGLVRDTAGNLYGTTAFGGAFGAGTVFKLDPAGVETVLFSFNGGSDGKYPSAGLVRDAAGNLYGTISDGGAFGRGAVFKVDATGTKSVLYSFRGGATDGQLPYAGLVGDATGNLYGTTFGGGALGRGTVFKLATTGVETVLYSFKGGADGKYPFAGLIRDASGNLYGTTFYGGASGQGTVFKLDTTGAETVLYAFKRGADGQGPYAGLVRDPTGNLYGTTFYGGASGQGTVFKLDTTGVETVLHSFTGPSDGAQPYAGLVRDAASNLYGTSQNGGFFGFGTVFRLDTTGKMTVLHHFAEGPDGQKPYAGLVRDAASNLYGTTSQGGALGLGTVFKLSR